MELPYGAIQTELLRAARGRQSQARLNQKLGLRSNRYHHWETGQSALPWRMFCRICQATKIPLAETLIHIAGFHENPAQGATLVKHLVGRGRQEEVAKNLGVSRSMISRWKSGKVDPSLEQMLRIINHSFFSLPQFLSRLVDIEKLPSLAEAHRREELERRLHFDHPWVAALLLFLRTAEYNALKTHREGFLSRKLGISLETEREVIQTLKTIGALEYEGEILTPTHRKMSTRGDEESERRTREHWTQHALNEIKKGLPSRDRNNWGYMVLNTGPETLPLIRERYFAFFNEVSAIVNSSTDVSDRVYVLNVQFLELDETKKRQSPS